jgi:hypothetical protein
MRTRVDDQLSAGSKNALAAFNRVLDQLGCREVLVEFDDLEFIRNGKNDDLSSCLNCLLICFPATR